MTNLKPKVRHIVTLMLLSLALFATSIESWWFAQYWDGSITEFKNVSPRYLLGYTALVGALLILFLNRNLVKNKEKKKIGLVESYLILMFCSLTLVTALILIGSLYLSPGAKIIRLDTDGAYETSDGVLIQLSEPAYYLNWREHELKGAKFYKFNRTEAYWIDPFTGKSANANYLSVGFEYGLYRNIDELEQFILTAKRVGDYQELLRVMTQKLVSDQDTLFSFAYRDTGRRVQSDAVSSAHQYVAEALQGGLRLTGMHFLRISVTY